MAADAALVIEVVMGATLLFGMVLARRGRYRAHGICQSSVVALNLGLIVFVMYPSFADGVVPGLPEALGRPYYWVAMVHAVLGTAAQTLGLFIVLRAGTNLLPRFMRFENYKLWMRTELALWWFVILFGIATYAVWI